MWLLRDRHGLQVILDLQFSEASTALHGGPGYRRLVSPPGKGGVSFWNDGPALSCGPQLQAVGSQTERRSGASWPQGACGVCMRSTWSAEGAGACTEKVTPRGAFCSHCLVTNYSKASEAASGSAELHVRYGLGERSPCPGRGAKSSPPRVVCFHSSWCPSTASEFVCTSAGGSWGKGRENTHSGSFLCRNSELSKQ